MPKEAFLANPTFTPDLQPLYALTESQYQAVIINLCNLIAATIEELQEAESSAL